ncbi:hypothetical protein PLICRDRAFT_28798 [Plicaturopsis crispa FD-325 SS-3]|nr:hypothetical protein PLICRDRAFT_28798 [Plicaturopsis crispa FD-325 SS-3]
MPSYRKLFRREGLPASPTDTGDPPPPPSTSSHKRKEPPPARSPSPPRKRPRADSPDESSPGPDDTARFPGPSTSKRLRADSSNSSYTDSDDTSPHPSPFSRIAKRKTPPPTLLAPPSKRPRTDFEHRPDDLNGVQSTLAIETNEKPPPASAGVSLRLFKRLVEFALPSSVHNDTVGNPNHFGPVTSLRTPHLDRNQRREATARRSRKIALTMDTQFATDMVQGHGDHAGNDVSNTVDANSLVASGRGGNNAHAILDHHPHSLPPARRSFDHSPNISDGVAAHAPLDWGGHPGGPSNPDADADEPTVVSRADRSSSISSIVQPKQSSPGDMGLPSSNGESDYDGSFSHRPVPDLIELGQSPANSEEIEGDEPIGCESERTPPPHASEYHGSCPGDSSRLDDDVNDGSFEAGGSMTDETVPNLLLDSSANGTVLPSGVDCDYNGTSGGHASADAVANDWSIANSEGSDTGVSYPRSPPVHSSTSSPDSAVADAKLDMGDGVHHGDDVVNSAILDQVHEHPLWPPGGPASSSPPYATRSSLNGSHLPDAGPHPRRTSGVKTHGVLPLAGKVGKKTSSSRGRLKIQLLGKVSPGKSAPGFHVLNDPANHSTRSPLAGTNHHIGTALNHNVTLENTTTSEGSEVLPSSGEADPRGTQAMPPLPESTEIPDDDVTMDGSCATAPKAQTTSQNDASPIAQSQMPSWIWVTECIMHPLWPPGGPASSSPPYATRSSLNGSHLPDAGPHPRRTSGVKTHGVLPLAGKVGKKTSSSRGRLKIQLLGKVSPGKSAPGFHVLNDPANHSTRSPLAGTNHHIGTALNHNVTLENTTTSEGSEVLPSSGEADPRGTQAMPPQPESTEIPDDDVTMDGSCATAPKAQTTSQNDASPSTHLRPKIRKQHKYVEISDEDVETAENRATASETQAGVHGTGPSPGQRNGENFTLNTPATRGDIATMMHYVDLRISGERQGRSQDDPPAMRNKQRRKLEPKTKSTDQITLQRDVRRHALKMMGRDNNHSAIRNLASESDLLREAAGKSSGPTAADFRIDLKGSRTSSWNRRAAMVFRKEFVKAGYAYPSCEAVEEAFLTHLKALKLQSKKIAQKLTGEISVDDADEVKERACQQRRHQTAHKRWEITRGHPDLQPFEPLLNSLPVGVHSEDEADHSNGQARYVIHDLPWRSPLVSEFFRVLDCLHLSTRFNANGDAEPGAMPRTRIPSGRKARNSKVPKGLPRNFYSEDFLQSLDEFEYRQYKIQPEVDLTHTEAMKRVAKRYMNASKKTPPLPRDVPLHSGAGPSTRGKA